MTKFLILGAGRPLTESGELNIVFDISDRKAPCGVSDSADCRKIGISVQRLIIDYAE